MGPHRFKLILCDLGNVLVKFDHRIAVRKILKFTDKSFDEVYQLFFDSPLTKDFEEGRISSREFFERISRALHLKGVTFKEFAVLWSDIFFDNKGIVPLLRRLKKNYRLHLISNINELHYSYLLKRFPSHFGIFDDIYLSYEVGRRKPHAEIYRRAMSDVNARPQDVLYIDDRADLIKEAQKTGMKTILFKNVADFRKQLERLKLL
jgi:HAD superfamily hydrolase (TIGR01549 family)